jgi:hypothetical protein
MTGRIESGQPGTVVPIDPATLEVGDIVLCKGHTFVTTASPVTGCPKKLFHAGQIHRERHQ